MIPRQTAIEEEMKDFVKEVHIIYIYLNASPCCIFLTNPANHFAAAMADSSRKLYEYAGEPLNTKYFKSHLQNRYLI